MDGIGVVTWIGAILGAAGGALGVIAALLQLGQGNGGGKAARYRALDEALSKVPADRVDAMAPVRTLGIAEWRFATLRPRVGWLLGRLVATSLTILLVYTVVLRVLAKQSDITPMRLAVGLGTSLAITAAGVLVWWLVIKPLYKAIGHAEAGAAELAKSTVEALDGEYVTTARLRPNRSIAALTTAIWAAQISLGTFGASVSAVLVRTADVPTWLDFLWPALVSGLLISSGNQVYDSWKTVWKVYDDDDTAAKPSPQPRPPARAGIKPAHRR